VLLDNVSSPVKIIVYFINFLEKILYVLVPCPNFQMSKVAFFVFCYFVSSTRNVQFIVDLPFVGDDASSKGDDFVQEAVMAVDLCIGGGGFEFIVDFVDIPSQLVHQHKDIELSFLRHIVQRCHAFPICPIRINPSID
jgi:hypothetical protein